MGTRAAHAVDRLVVFDPQPLQHLAGVRRRLDSVRAQVVLERLEQVRVDGQLIPLEKVVPEFVEKAYPQNQALSILLPREAKEVCQVSMLSKSEEVVSVYVFSILTAEKLRVRALGKKGFQVLF